MIAGNGFEPLAGRPPDRRAGFSHATARLRLRNRSLCGRPLEGPLAVGGARSAHPADDFSTAGCQIDCYAITGRLLALLSTTS